MTSSGRPSYSSSLDFGKPSGAEAVAEAGGSGEGGARGCALASDLKKDGQKEGGGASKRQGARVVALELNLADSGLALEVADLSLQSPYFLSPVEPPALFVSIYARFL